VVEITGTDDEGYDYSYRPSAAARGRSTTTLSRGPSRGEVGGLNKLASLLLLAPKQRNAPKKYPIYCHLYKKSYPDDTYKIRMKDPRDMSVKELKREIAKAGLGF